MEQKIRWGIIGCGNAARLMARDMAKLQDCEITAVASRTLAKAEALKEEF